MTDNSVMFIDLCYMKLDLLLKRGLTTFSVNKTACELCGMERLNHCDNPM